MVRPRSSTQATRNSHPLPILEEGAKIGEKEKATVGMDHLTRGVLRVVPKIIIKEGEMGPKIEAQKERGRIIRD